MPEHATQADELLAQYQARLAELGELRRKIAEISGTASSARQGVKITVNVQGEIIALEFPSGAYKRMPPAELSAEILATAQAAKAKAQEQFSRLVTPEIPLGSRLVGLAQGTADPTEFLGSEPPMPAAVRDYIETGRLAAP